MPLAGNALERSGAALREAQPRARHQILCDARNQNLIRTRKPGHTCADVNSDAANKPAQLKIVTAIRARKTGSNSPLGTERTFQNFRSVSAFLDQA